MTLTMILTFSSLAVITIGLVRLCKMWIKIQKLNYNIHKDIIEYNECEKLIC